MVGVTFQRQLSFFCAVRLAMNNTHAAQSLLATELDELINQFSGLINVIAVQVELILDWDAALAQLPESAVLNAGAGELDILLRFNRFDPCL